MTWPCLQKLRAKSRARSRPPRCTSPQIGPEGLDSQEQSPNPPPVEFWGGYFFETSKSQLVSVIQQTIMCILCPSYFSEVKTLSLMMCHHKFSKKINHEPGPQSLHDSPPGSQDEVCRKSSTTFLGKLLQTGYPPSTAMSQAFEKKKCIWGKSNWNRFDTDSDDCLI